MKPTVADLNRGVAAVHAALSPKLTRLEDAVAVALRSLAAIVSADLNASVTAAAWTGPSPEALTDDLRRRLDEAWQARHSTIVQRVEVEAMRTTYGELSAALGVSLDLRNPVIDGQVRQLRNRSTLPDSAWGIVRESLQGSHDEGLGIPDAAKALRTKVAGMAPYRARMIARTELIGIANRGSITAARLAGVGGFKSWLATADARTRDAHALAQGQTVPLDDVFVVGGEDLDYPGDSMGSAGNVINCRCTVVYADEPDGYTGEVQDSGLLARVPDVPDVPANAPMSQVLDTVDYKGGNAAEIRAARDAIDSVHTLPELPVNPSAYRVPIVHEPTSSTRAGWYDLERPRGGGVRSIHVGSSETAVGVNADARMTLAHEVGHYIDNRHMPAIGRDPVASDPTSYFGSTGASEGVAVLDDAYEEAFAEVMGRLSSGPTDGLLRKVGGEYGRYLASPHERFARGYAQWIATRSGDARMLSAIRAEVSLREAGAEALDYGRGLRAWPEDEFGPIADAFDALFRSRGMLRE